MDDEEALRLIVEGKGRPALVCAVNHSASLCGIIIIVTVSQSASAKANKGAFWARWELRWVIGVVGLDSSAH